jgi:hypothetical protein
MNINTGAQKDQRYLDARLNEKGCLKVWGGDALSSASPPIPSKYIWASTRVYHTTIQYKLFLHPHSNTKKVDSIM